MQKLDHNNSHLLEDLMNIPDKSTELITPNEDGSNLDQQ